MNSLENINKKILEDAQRETDLILEKTAQKVKEILTQADETAKEICSKAADEAQKASLTEAEKASSAAKQQCSQRILAFKIEQIQRTLDQAAQRLHAMDRNDYFTTLVKIAAANALKKDGVMLMSARDLTDKPADFEKRVSQATGTSIKIGDRPAEIGDGFIMVYGDVEIDCTFDELIHTKRDELRDLVNDMLF